MADRIEATTFEEVIARFQATKHSDDPEQAHIEADDLLLDALRLCGRGDVVDAYIEVSADFFEE